MNLKLNLIKKIVIKDENVFNFYVTFHNLAYIEASILNKKVKNSKKSLYFKKEQLDI